MVDRYDFTMGASTAPDGQFVEHTDYAALEARLRDAVFLLREVKGWVPHEKAKWIDTFLKSGSPETPCGECGGNDT